MAYKFQPQGAGRVANYAGAIYRMEAAKKGMPRSARANQNAMLR